MMYVNQFRREERYDVHRARLRAHGRIASLHQHADHARLVHEAHLSVPAQAAQSRAAARQPRLAGRAADRQLLREHRAIFSASSKASHELLEDSAVTSVRLVTNPEKMVLRETQRAFVYFSLHGLTVDQDHCESRFAGEMTDGFFTEWRASQAKVLAEIESLLRAYTG